MVRGIGPFLAAHRKTRRRLCEDGANTGILAQLPSFVKMFFMEERQIEREFGVPVPGKILPQAQWTRTALKKLPAEGPLDWQGIFGRVAPAVVDIGCGNGRF